MDAKVKYQDGIYQDVVVKDTMALSLMMLVAGGAQPLRDWAVCYDVLGVRAHSDYYCYYYHHSEYLWAAFQQNMPKAVYRGNPIDLDGHWNGHSSNPFCLSLPTCKMGIIPYAQWYSAGDRYYFYYLKPCQAFLELVGEWKRLVLKWPPHCG